MIHILLGWDGYCLCKCIASSCLTGTNYALVSLYGWSSAQSLQRSGFQTPLISGVKVAVLKTLVSERRPGGGWKRMSEKLIWLLCQEVHI
jgi:hypothetical protein